MATDWTSFFDGTLADYSQAIGSLGTLLIAWLAYRTWRRPDDAKRRADTAQELMRASVRFESALLAARVPVVAWGLDPTAAPTHRDLLDQFEDAVHDKNELKLAEARKLALELDAMRTEARGILSAKIADDVEAMFKMYKDVEFAFIMAEQYQGSDLTELPEKGLSYLKEYLRALGLRYGAPGSEADEDAFEDEFKSRGDALRKKLVPYLISKPNPL